MSEQRNTTASAEDFLLPEQEELTLPSGLKVVLRPPNSLEFFAQLGMLPGQLVNALRGEKPPERSAEEIIESVYKIICLVVVSPKFSLEPKPGEWHPRRLRNADRKAIDDWAGKYLDLGGGGADLTTFRAGPSGPTAADGASGGDVPKQDAVGVPEGPGRDVGV